MGRKQYTCYLIRDRTEGGAFKTALGFYINPCPAEPGHTLPLQTV